MIQYELAEVWRYFDAEEYVKSVLAHAPLMSGVINVERREHLGFVRYLTNLTKLHVTDLRDVVDLDWIRRLPCLDLLNVSTKRPLVDLTPLREHCDLTCLIIQGEGVSGGFDIFSELSNMSGILLNFGSDVRSVDFVNLMPKLTQLWLGRMSSVENLEPIRMLSRLTRLELGTCKADPVPVVLQCPSVTDLRFFEGSLRQDLSRIKPILPRLTSFGVAGAPIGDSAPLSSLTQATSVRLGYLTHPDLRPLVGLSNLRDINLVGCGSEVDVSPLVALPRRVTIRLEQGSVRGLDAVRGRHRIIRR